jgi:AcrR family transcriptional regulator
VDRLTAADYFREALVVLGEHGSDALTIATLCERLDVTKGSFYHHFGGMPGFVEQLLTYWEAEHSNRLIAISRALPNPAERVTTLVEVAVGLPHASEAALRAWGRSRPEVADAVARADKRRERHLSDAVAALGIERQRARLLGRMALHLLIGTQQREDPVDLKRLRQMFQEYSRLLLAEAEIEPAGRPGRRP